MEGFPWMCRAHVAHVSAQVKVTVKGQILNKQILDIMFCLLCKYYTNGKLSLILAQLPMCQFKVKVTIEHQLSYNQI